MVAYPDTLAIVNNLLDSDWLPANTDSTTPIISKIYERSKEMNLRTNDYVLTYQTNTQTTPIESGSTPKAQVNEFLKVDIRVYDKDADDTHAKKVLNEVARILYNNRLNVQPDFDELSPFGDMQDLSDKTRKIFRYVLSFKLIAYCKVMN